MRASLYWWGYAVPPNLSFNEVATQFYNVWRRNVPARPRRVHEAAELKVPSGHAPAFSQFRHKVEDGEDLRKHMSGSIEDAAYEDGLFNDWQIQHFHFVERPARSGQLVYAIVKPDDFYIVGIHPHGYWSHRELLERIHRNWPALIARHRATSALGTESGPRSDQDIALLRKAGISSFLELSDGAVYFSPGGGTTSAATSIQTTRLILATVARLRQCETWIKANASQVLQEICNAGRTPADSTDSAVFRLLVRGNDLFALESTSKVAYALGPLFENTGQN